MTGDADLPQRSSSPLKRRASSMDPDQDTEIKGASTPNPADTSDKQNDESTRSATTEYPRAMSVDLPNGKPSHLEADAGTMGTSDLPPLETQIKTIKMILDGFNQETLTVGRVGYAVSNTWLSQAISLGDPSSIKKQTGERLGPVDNTDIIRDIVDLSDGSKFARLKPGVSLSELTFFPDNAWDLVVAWYGLKDGQVPIQRWVINTAVDAVSAPNIVFEMNPPVFTIHRLWSSASGIIVEKKLKEAPPVVIVVSSASPYNDFFRTIKNDAGISMDRKMRVFSIPPEPETIPTEVELRSAFTPPDSPVTEQDDVPEAWATLLVGLDAFTKVDSSRRIKVEAADHTNNPNYNGKSTLSQYSLAQDQILVLDEEVSKNDFVSTTFRKRGGEKAIATRSAAQANDTNSGRNSPALSTRSGPVTRGRTRQKKVGKNVGVVGLTNLGNTCYMNSALQCIRSVEELTKYFLVNEYKQEINADNPLGWGGSVASSYGSLLRDIYTDSKSSVAPREFKNTIGRCRPTFSGWAQQDTQEFLGFLLDGLQEDLNRIEKKPYIEKPDSTDEMIGNDEAIREMADKVWDITRRRDDSVIADLFTGMYKSTLQCPVCDKISITFDPFNNLTLPIPVEDLWSHKIRFYPLNDAPVLFNIDLPKHSALSLVKKFIADRTGVPPGRLVGAEEFKGKFYKIYDDGQDVSEIGSSDVGTYHEVESEPTNFPAKPQSMLDIDGDPRIERLLVPVIHRQLKSKSYGGGGEPVPPHFIILTPEEAASEDTIRRKVLEKVATFSTWHGFVEDDEMVDQDAVITTQSDVESSGDSKVVAYSVQGEDDMVEVSMKEANSTTATGNSPVLKDFNRKRPTWADPAQHLPGQLQNLFELGYFAEKGFPTGWQLAEGDFHPRLSTRAPPPDTSSEHEESNSPGTCTTGADSDRESTSDHLSQASEPVQTRMNDESSDEAAPVQRPVKTQQRNQKYMARAGPGGRKKIKPGNGKGFGKKGGKRRNKEAKVKGGHQPFDIPPQPTPGDDSCRTLLRYGEGIVVYWNDDAFDIAFGKPLQSDEENRGAKTFMLPDTITDPALAKRRVGRESRRKNGCTLEECLDEFERAEVLSEHDEWYCPRCKEHRRASKKFDLWKSPDILVVHLKRFSSAGYRREKLDVLVQFPVEGLDLTTRVLNKENGKAEIFDLIAVDEHSGGLGGGHYTAAAKNFIDGRWYHFNDSHASPCQPETAITRMAYLLFYRRRGSGALGGKRFQDILERFDQENASDEDDMDEQSMSGAGEGQRLGDGSYLNGSSRHGLGAGATRPHDLGLASSTMSTQGHDASLPQYDEGSSTVAGSDTIHDSIEDEGIGLMESSAAYHPNQEWSFNSINTQDGSTPDSYASDDAQASDGPDMSFMDHNSASGLGSFEGGVVPPPDSTAQAGLSDIQTQAWDREIRERVIAVPADDDDAASTEAAEIHLDDDSQQLATAKR